MPTIFRDCHGLEVILCDGGNSWMQWLAPKFCFYYSAVDWHHPEFPARYSQRGFHGDPNPNMDDRMRHTVNTPPAVLAPIRPLTAAPAAEREGHAQV